jgi:hypothetical protein
VADYGGHGRILRKPKIDFWLKTTIDAGHIGRSVAVSKVESLLNGRKLPFQTRSK